MPSRSTDHVLGIRTGVDHGVDQCVRHGVVQEAGPGSCWAVRARSHAVGRHSSHRLKDAVDDVNRGVVGLHVAAHDLGSTVDREFLATAGNGELVTVQCRVLSGERFGSDRSRHDVVREQRRQLSTRISQYGISTAGSSLANASFPGAEGDLLGTVQRVREPRSFDGSYEHVQRGFSAAAVTMGRVAMLARLPGPSAGMAAQRTRTRRLRLALLPTGSRRA